MRISLCLTLVCLALAVFLPPLGIRRAAHDTLVVFDITQSMNVRDYEANGLPVSRLEFARESMRHALRELPCGSRIGWAVFAEYRTLVLLAPIEVCGNYADLVASLDRIDGRMRWGNASEIAKGVFWAMRGARDVGGHTHVVFLTDGQEAPPLDGAGPALFSDLKPGDIDGFLIGAGGYVPQPIPRTDEDDRTVGVWSADDVLQRTGPAGGPPVVSHEELSEVRESYLRGLARRVGFDYAHLTGAETLRRAILDPRTAERRPQPTSLNWLAGAAALALLATAFGGLSWPGRRRWPSQPALFRTVAACERVSERT